MGLAERGFRDKHLARQILDRIEREMAGAPPVRLMEVCGTHTMSIGRFGLRRALPPNLRLLSGPGCPVCVTPGGYIDAAAKLALSGIRQAHAAMSPSNGGVTVVTFGDMVRVPGNETSLEEARANGGRVVVASSANAAVDIARTEQGDVVFLAVGFETTAPTVAAAVLRAERERLCNFSVLVSHKLVPPALRLILDDPECAVSGFILPGHVSTVIGTKPYQFIADEFGVPGVVAGFELIDVLAAIESLVHMVRAGEAAVVNGYTRVVRAEGNPKAWEAVLRVFTVADAAWRGIGVIPMSGLELRPEYSAFDAARRYGVELMEPRIDANTRESGSVHPRSLADGGLAGSAVPKGCACGRVLRGVIRPSECPLFGGACTPERPVGPCMVSIEGACSVSYRYGEK